MGTTNEALQSADMVFKIDDNKVEAPLPGPSSRNAAELKMHGEVDASSSLTLAAMESRCEILEKDLKYEKGLASATLRDLAAQLDSERAKAEHERQSHERILKSMRGELDHVRALWKGAMAAATAAEGALAAELRVRDHASLQLETLPDRLTRELSSPRALRLTSE